jgi:hypothetical protein
VVAGCFPGRGGEDPHPGSVAAVGAGLGALMGTRPNLSGQLAFAESWMSQMDVSVTHFDPSQLRRVSRRVLEHCPSRELPSDDPPLRRPYRPRQGRRDPDPFASGCGLSRRCSSRWLSQLADIYDDPEAEAARRVGRELPSEAALAVCDEFTTTGRRV